MINEHVMDSVRDIPGSLLKQKSDEWFNRPKEKGVGSS